MNKSWQFLFVLFMFLTTQVSAQTSAVVKDSKELLADMTLVGSADFRFLFWKIYEAELYSNNGEFDYFHQLPFALNLTYKRAFTAEQLASETRNQFMMLGLPEEDINIWVDRLQDIYVDVSPDDSLLLYIDEQAQSHFYFNSVYLGSVENEAFSRHFSAIWLARDDRYADFTQRLTGGDV